MPLHLAFSILIDLYPVVFVRLKGITGRSVLLYRHQNKVNDILPVFAADRQGLFLWFMVHEILAPSLLLVLSFGIFQAYCGILAFVLPLRHGFVALFTV